MFRNFLLLTSRRALHVMSEQTEAKQTLRVATFNVLAPCYNWLSGWWDRSESSKPNLYLPRFHAIKDLISKQTPSLDVVCLQEFWFHDDVMDLFDSQFDKKYRIVKLKRPGFKTDGLAILVDRSINILCISPIRFNDMNRRVALLVHLLLPEEQEAKLNVRQYFWPAVFYRAGVWGGWGFCAGAPHGLQLGFGYQVILMTTHLTYCSNYIDHFLRMWQIKKVKSEIESYQEKNNLQHVPVVLAGDFNGCPEDAVYSYVVENGFTSSYKTVHNREPQVTHRLYSGEEILVDYIFYRNSSPCHLVPKQSMVLPAEYSDEEWPKEFTLSDHRMIVTEFELETKESIQPDSQTSDMAGSGTV